MLAVRSSVRENPFDIPDVVGIDDLFGNDFLSFEAVCNCQDVSGEIWLP